MAYWLTAWNGLTVPTALGDRGSMDIAAGQADAPLIQLPGGRVFDPLGSSDAYVPSAQYTARVLIVSNTPTTIKTVLDTWQAKRGKVGSLTRTPDNGATAQTVTARLIRADVNRTLMGSRIVPLNLVFQAVNLPWQSGGVTNVLTKATISVHDYTVTVTNAGNVVQKLLQIIVTPAAGTTMTAFQISSATHPLLRWTGSVAPTKILLIDTGMRHVFNDGAAAYAGLTPPTTSEEWFAMEAGANSVTYQATWSGGTGVDVSIGLQDAWG